MTPEAERLQDLVGRAITRASILRPSHTDLADAAIRAIVTELGITEEMVEALKVAVVDSTEQGFTDHAERLFTGVKALSTLLEVAKDG